MSKEPKFSLFPERDAPQSIEAEQGLLGLMLVDERHVHAVGDIIDARHFFYPVHGRIFDAIMILINRDSRANPITLKAYFENDHSLSDIGGTQYLARLVGSNVGLLGAADYASVILEAWQRRELIGVAGELSDWAYDPSADMTPDRQIESAEAALAAISDSAISDNRPTSSEAVMAATVAAAERAYNEGGPAGVQTGLGALDNQIGVLGNAELIVLAGRPSMGKTALATKIINNVAQHGLSVLFFSLEMSEEQIGRRFLSPDAMIPISEIRGGKFDLEAFERLREAASRRKGYKITVDASSSLTVQAIRHRALRRHRIEPIDLVVVDHMGLIAPSPSAESRSRVDQVEEVSNGLKALAKDIDRPILALQQLNRGVEGRDDKRPGLSDLRSGGSIEQDADTVMFVYREEYYLAGREPSDDKKRIIWEDKLQKSRGRAEIIVAKQRDGPTGVASLAFDEQLATFRDWRRDDRWGMTDPF